MYFLSEAKATIVVYYMSFAQIMSAVDSKKPGFFINGTERERFGSRDSREEGD
jgi:hypothetical protein